MFIVFRCRSVYITSDIGLLILIQFKVTVFDVP
jgi:hypothetical protein